MKEILLDDIYIFVKITREIHVVDNFKIKIDILISKRIIIDFVTQFIKINNYRNIIISINSRARFESIKRIIKSFNKIILILIIYAKMLSKNRNLFFEL